MTLATDQLVMKANTTTTELAALITKIWAARIEPNLRKSAVLQQSLTVFTELLAPNAGDTLYIPLLPDLSAASALTEDTDMVEVSLGTATSIALVPTEYGKAVGIRRKALDRIGYDGVSETLDRLTDSMTQLLETQVASLYNASVPTVGGSPTAFYQGGHDNTNVTTSDIITGAQIRKAVKTFKAANVPTFDDGYYHLYIHSNMWDELYNDTDTREDLRFASPQEMTLNGEMARLYGAKLILSNFIKTSAEGASSAVTVYNNMMVAPRWACVAWKRKPGLVIDPTLYDYGRKRKFGILSDHKIELLHNERVIVLKSA